MAVLNPYAQYKDLTVNTATPGMLIIMLFEGAVKNINIAIKAIDEKNVQQAHDALIKTQDIYSSLMFSLNENVQISAQLKNLYAYILDRLAEANIKKDVDILHEVLGYTQEFRDTWKEAERKIHMGQS